MSAEVVLDVSRAPGATAGSTSRGLLVAIATLTAGVWSLAVRLVHPSASRTVVEVPDVEVLSPLGATHGWLDLDAALIEAGFHRVAGWSSDADSTKFKASVQRFPVVPVPSWADRRFDVRPCLSLAGDVSVTFEKTFGDAGDDFESECSVYLTQTFRLIGAELNAEPAVVHVHAEAPSLDVATALEVAKWLTSAGALAEQINASLPVQRGRAA